MSGLKLLGLLGRAGSGKSAGAEYLEWQHGFKIISFAAPLKRMVRDIWEFSDDQLYGSTESKERVDPRWNLSPRDCFQRLGQSARTHLGEDVWVRALIRTIRGQDDGKGDRLFVIDDCRYANEVSAIISWQLGRVVRIDCPVQDTNKTHSSHPSETQIDSIDSAFIYDTIINEKTPAFFHALDKIVKEAWA